jgi:FkbM family methyltransferase
VSILTAWFSSDSLRFRIRAVKALLRDQRVELGAIRKQLRPGDIACDIGANKGRFIYWLSSWTKNGRVVAFEPQPDLASGLADVCRTIGLSNVTVEAKAVYSRSGTQELYVPKGHQPGASLHSKAVEAGEFTTFTAPMVSLDEYFGNDDKIGFLKIDVEGAELEVLRGAERILRERAPLLVFECENRHLAPGSVYDVFSYLGRLGYEGSFICGGKLLPLGEFDAAVHQSQRGSWFWKRSGYCNNFIFRNRAGS